MAADERVPKLTAERRAELLRWLETGLPLEMAAQLAGFALLTVTEWRRRCANGVPGYITLEDDIHKALARGESIHLSRIAEAGRTQWRASAWLLERMYPEKYAPPMPTVPDAPPLSTQEHDSGLAGL
jgi:transposase